MDAIAAEIARKRQLQQDAKTALGGAGGPRKWVKRGEVEKVREQQHLEEEKRLAEERSKKAIAPQFRLESAEEERKAISAAAAAASSEETGGADGAAGGERQQAVAGGKMTGAAEKENMKPAEVKRKLRLLGQPIQLFGEEDEDRFERYRAVSSALPSESEINDQLKAGQGWGQSDRQLFDESGKAKPAAEKSGLAAAVAADGGKEEEDGEDELAEEFVATTPEQTISRHFKQLLKLWEAELAERPEAEAASLPGRQATAAFQQGKRHMRPFFRLLRQREMPLDVLGTMVEITTFMQQREYVKAHDAYIRCAIGNAPWPMGITGTGIHERQGRQHLRESKVAHVMNDETQRKYLQSVKRLMTFAQKAFPAAPSKSVG